VSARVLRALQQRHAFDPTPPEADLGNLHVPFDTLTGTQGYEDRLAGALRRGERVALIGRSGAGKSSITEHVLGSSFVQDLAPIKIRVGLDPASVITDPGAFTRHLVRTVARHLEQNETGRRRRAAREFSRGGRQRPVKLTVSAGMPWLTGELAADIGTVAAQEPLSGNEVLEQAQQILALIGHRKLKPVLVLDDTDHWLTRVGLPEPAQLLAGFGDVLRVLAEGLPAAAAVVAVHTSYLSDQHHQQA
jgi:ABC-type dipeptide/oligopeptide/nickel transport system ATPase component